METTTLQRVTAVLSMIHESPPAQQRDAPVPR
jgi:hypothetical protein